jgi:hypothetical protein
VLVVKGLRRGTRLMGVIPLKERDGINSYFNDDNCARLDNCVRWGDGNYSFFASVRNCTIRFRVVPAGELLLRNPYSEQASLLAPTPTPTDQQAHAGLMHGYDEYVRSSHIVVKGIDVKKICVSAANCPGCRMAMTRQPRMTGSAPSQGGSRKDGLSERTPSTVDYTHFGQRVDTDINHSLPPSWPHKFTAMTNFCDRHTAEWYVSFMVTPDSTEVVSALEHFEESTKGRLLDGKIAMWHVDNDFAFEGAMKSDTARELIARMSQTVPNEQNNPVPERLWRSVNETIRRVRGYAESLQQGTPDMPKCMWPYIVSQMQVVKYFITTKAHNPMMSPYEFSYPDGEPADLTWAEPLFCDVTVHLAKRDRDDKVSYTAADGCYLMHDFKRNCQLVYLPELQRIGHFHVRVWMRSSFECVKGITPDTPVQYREPDDLFFGQGTAAKLPGRYQLPRATAAIARGEPDNETLVGPTEQSLEQTLAESAARITTGVDELLATDSDVLLKEIVAQQRAQLTVPEVLQQASNVGEWGDENTEFEVVLIGTESAKATVSTYSQIVKIKGVHEAMASPYWPQIKEGMEKEISGKLANGFAEVVKDVGQHKMKSKWVILVYLGDDGRVLVVKCRLVACGYSQRWWEYDKTSAPTLPGPSYRTFCSIVNDEELETDSIDAVKAFTQADADKVLYTAMPIGFSLVGYILKLLKNLEGTKQGSWLWYKKNKWAWNKCGVKADMAEPNLYTHPILNIIIAVFADDIGVGFKLSVRAEYLAMRGEYSKLIKIDSPGPDVTVPISQFIGTEWERDRQAKTLKVTQVKYIAKLAKKYEGKFTLNEMPFGQSEAKRKAFEALPGLEEGKEADKAEYLSLMGDIGWPSVTTRPEIAYAFSILSSCTMKPLMQHFEAGLYVIGYLVNTNTLGLTFGGVLKVPMGLTSFPRNFEQTRGLWASTDSSWGTRPRPQGGHVIFRCNAATVWSSKALKLIPDSTCEAETAEGSRATKSCTFKKALVSGVGRPAHGPLPMTCDNKAMYHVVEKEGSSHRTRHFERATMLIKWAVMKLLVALYLVRSAECVADIFTKAVDKATFMKMRAMLLNMPFAEASLSMASRIAKLLSRSSHSA